MHSPPTARAGCEDDARMDGPTVGLYDTHAARWAASRGVPADDLGPRFRAQVGDGAVLDAGCGVGRYLARLGMPTVGLDATPAMLDLARGRGAPLVRADLERLPFVDGAFAGLFAHHTYLHLRKDRTPGAFAEAARVVRPGGSVLVTLIAGGYEGRSLPDDDIPGRWFSLWEPSEVESVLRAAGFSGVQVEEVRTRRGRDLVATGTRRTPPPPPRT